MEAKRESTKARCYNFLAMCCDGYLKTQYHDRRVAKNYLTRIAILCEVLKIDMSSLNKISIVKKYRPDLFEQDFYDGIRKYVK